MPATATVTATTPSLDGFGAVLARCWTWGRRLLWVAGAGAAIVVVLEAIRLYELLARVDPWVARGAFLLLAVAFAVLAARAIQRYLRAPRALTPPHLPEPATGWSPRQRQRFASFAEEYLRRQLVNPHLPDSSRRLVPAAIEAIRTEAHRQPPKTDSPAAAAALERLARCEIDRVLAPLDERARGLIRRAAVEVATATAVSPSVLLDALITLNRNVDLVSRLADLYYGRPGPVGTLRVVRDVVGAAVTAGALEVVSDHLSGALAEMTGSWTSRLIGPLGQGMINGVVTMRFGAAARWRCRSLVRRRVPWRPWQLGQYRRATRSLLGWISDELGPSVVDPLRKVASWTNRAVDSTVDGGRRWVRKARGHFGAADTAAGEQRPAADDPLVEAGLLDGPEPA